MLPSLRCTGTFTVNASSTEPMDTTPTEHELVLLKKDLELQKLKSELSKTDSEKQILALEKELVLKEKESHARETQLLMEKNQIELHYRYAFQSENARQIGRAAIEQ